MPVQLRGPHAGAMSEASDSIQAPSSMAATVLWAFGVLGGLVLMGNGLLAGVFFDTTSPAVAEAEQGLALVVVARLLLSGCAAWARLAARMPVWVVVAVVAP